MGIQRGCVIPSCMDHLSIFKDQGNFNQFKTFEREDVFGCLRPFRSRVCEEQLPSGHTYAGLMHCGSHTRYSN